MLGTRPSKVLPGRQGTCRHSSPNVASTCLKFGDSGSGCLLDLETLERVVSEPQLTVPLRCGVAPAGENLCQHTLA